MILFPSFMIVPSIGWERLFLAKCKLHFASSTKVIQHHKHYPFANPIDHEQKICFDPFRLLSRRYFWLWKLGASSADYPKRAIYPRASDTDSE